MSCNGNTDNLPAQSTATNGFDFVWYPIADAMTSLPTPVSPVIRTGDSGLRRAIATFVKASTIAFDVSRFHFGQQSGGQAPH